jgi:protease-4
MRDFFKSVLASFVALLLFSTLSLGALIALLAMIAVGAQRSSPLVEKDSVLILDLSVDILDSGPAADPSTLLSDALTGSRTPAQTSLWTVLRGLETAAEDDRILGILIQGNISPNAQGTGFATLSEVRSALQTFQESGKPIYAYTTDWSEREYYLTSLADTVILDPTGIMELDGLSIETTFFSGALERFGIDVQVIRAGNFKSAVEPFLRTDNSPENAQQLQALLDDLWNEFLSAAGSSRDLQPTQIQQLTNTQGLLLADEALNAGLVDETAYGSGVIDQLRELTGESAETATRANRSFRSIDLVSYAQANPVEPTRGGTIAVLYADGDIVSGEGGIGSVGGDRFSRLLREIREDEDIEAVVVRVNSPGGGASPAEMIAHEVQLTREVKPVIISMGNVAASGGYMIAAYGDRIFASPNTITGSIGVFGLIANIQELANENGITWDVVKTGPFADAQTLARPLTPQELARFQQVVDRTYDTFLDTVAAGRSLERNQVEAVAQGRVWSGVQAQEVGLVDELGGLTAALDAAAAAAELGDDWNIREYPEPLTLEQRILASLFGVSWRDRLFRSTPADPLTAELQDLHQQIEILSRFNDPRRVYFLMPFIPTIR